MIPIIIEERRGAAMVAGDGLPTPENERIGIMGGTSGQRCREHDQTAVSELRPGLTTVTCAIVLLAGTTVSGWAAGTTERVSVATGGGQGNRPSGYTTPFDSGAFGISADGRFVAFDSLATNLVPGDTNKVQDIFVRDRGTGTTARVTVAPGGAQANNANAFPTISADSRFVAFGSAATNLIPGDTLAGGWLVHDRRTGRNERVSVSSNGAPGNAPPGAAEVFIFGRPVAISADGRFVAFIAASDNLVAGDTNDQIDVFVRDRQAGTTERVSVATGGAQATGDSGENPFFAFGVAISAGGRFVAFGSQATNLVPGDTNGKVDIFVRDRQAGTTARISVGTGGVQADRESILPAISGDGRFVAFASPATNLVAGDTRGYYDVFVRDRAAGTTERVSVGPGGVQGNASSVSCSISAEGRFVAFNSRATNLVPGDTNRRDDAFVRDRRTGRTERVSLDAGGGQATWASYGPTISANGSTVAFENPGPGLVPGDTNNQYDVFVRTR